MSQTITLCKYAITVWLLALTVIAGAATIDFRFRHYTVGDGLPSSTVRAITQDKLGFMWFGTDNGLCRYDGISIKRYSYSSEVNEQFVSCLYDEGDHLWIGTFKGIYLYEYITARFTKFNKRTLDGKTIEGDILSITADKDGSVWVATMDEGVFRYSKKAERLDHYQMKAIEGKVSCVMVDDANQVWAVTNWAVPALWRLDKARNDFVEVSVAGMSAGDLRSLTITQDRVGDIWVGTWDKGLVRIGGNGTMEHKAGFSPQHIHCILDYAPNQLLIGSDDGLSLYNTANGSWRTYNEDETNQFSLSNRFVYPIVKDGEGGIWIGTFYGGINYLMPNVSKFVGFASSKLRNSIAGNVVNRFCEDYKGNIWIASDDGALCEYSPKDNRFKHYSPENSGLSYHNVHALCADGKDLWIGTYTGGVNRMDLETGRFTRYQLPNTNEENTSSSSCYSLFKDSRGRLWATSMESIFLFDSGSNSFKLVKNIGILTIDIDEDSRGNIFFSTQGKGLFVYESSTGHFVSIRQGTKPNSLLSDQVNNTLIDSNGNYMVATEKGLCQYNPNTGGFTKINLDIPSQEVYGIVEDNGVYWLATGCGIVRYQKGAPIQRFTKDDGLQSDQSLPNAVFKASDGRIYVGSQSGFNAFYPYEIVANKTVPSVYVTGLEVLNKPLDDNEKANIAIIVGASNEVELPYDANSIVINFTSLSYCAPGKNQYKYKLEGYDRDWIKSNGRPRATYTNLPPGSYLFRVRGTNNDGVWCSEDCTLKIVVTPPFYLSLPMKVVYLLLAVAVIFFGVKYMLRLSNRKHEREIRRMKAEQEKEVREAKIQFFTMIAHEIRTPVSLIIGPLENIMKSPESIPVKIRNNMDMIDRNAHRLLYLVNQLLDFRKVQTNSFVTHIRRNNLRQLVEAVSERFKPTFEQKHIAFSVVYPPANFTAMIDAEAVTKVISNLLTNANKYTHDSVTLECVADAGSETFTIVVSDNGVGVKAEDQQRIFQPFYQASDNKPGTGIGLSIVKSIVDQHHGTVSVKSVYGQGSTFTVTLPVGNDIETEDETDDKLPKVDEGQTTPTDSRRSESNDLPTMLIVEDNEDMLAFLESNFQGIYNVITARDGVEGLDKLRHADVTLIVSDWMMPRMSGVELCEAVRHDANISHIPFILLTAKTDDESKAKGMDCGADIYIEKPFSVKVLKSSIANMIELRRMLRERFSTRPMESITRITNNPLDSSLLQAMQKTIEENLDNANLNVSFLAESMGISRSALFSKIKTLADVTPNEMIHMIRLKAAAKLLSEGNLSVSEVSYKVGFSSPSYFTKCFQKQFGIKPAEMVKDGKTVN